MALRDNLKSEKAKERYDKNFNSIETTFSQKELEEHEQEIRNKAIDEFASELINHAISADIGKGNDVKMAWVSPVTRIKEIAEQMKGGE